MRLIRAVLLFPMRAARHWRLFRDLFFAAFATNPATRASALAGIGALVRNRQLYATADQRMGSAKGFAKTVLAECPGLRAHLAVTPHLGALQPLSSHPLDRAAYVSLQVDLLLKAKKRHRRLGLGSPGGRETRIEYGGRPLTGLDIAQSWALVLSWGHLFGTFATERALLYHLKRSEGAVEAFVAEVHPKLRVYVERILRGESFYRFSHALTAFRISRTHMDESLRIALVEVLSLYLDEGGSVRAQRLRKLFYVARQLSYLSLHQVLELPRVEIGTEFGELPPELILDDGITFEPFAASPSPLANLMNALDRFQFDSFFTGKPANRLVLQHLREFNAWWRDADARRLSIPARVEQLWTRPEDWPTLEPDPSLKAVVQLHLPLAERRWVDEAAAWHDDGRSWPRASFLITYPPGAELASCTVLAEDRLQPPTVHHVASRLAVHCERTWSTPANSDVSVWRSVAGLGRVMLSYVVPEELEVIVRPVRATSGSIGFAAIGRGPEEVARRVELFASRCGEPTRSSELKTLSDYIAAQRTSGDTTLAFLGQVLLVDRRTNEERHELDGVVAQVSRDRVEWHVLEMKVRGSSPRAQLERLATTIRVDASLGTTGQRGVAVLRAKWPSTTRSQRRSRG